MTSVLVAALLPVELLEVSVPFGIELSTPLTVRVDTYLLISTATGSGEDIAS